MDVQDRLDNAFVNIAQRMVRRYLPHASDDDKREAQAEIAELGYSILDQVKYHMGSEGTPWEGK